MTNEARRVLIGLSRGSRIIHMNRGGYVYCDSPQRDIPVSAETVHDLLRTGLIYHEHVQCLAITRAGRHAIGNRCLIAEFFNTRSGIEATA